MKLLHSDVESFVAKGIREAVEHYRNITHIWPSLWLDYYYDPRQSFEDNCKAAWQAVCDGWRPWLWQIEEADAIKAHGGCA